MKPFLLFILISLGCLSHAQKTIDVSSGDVNPLSPALFEVVAGEPFISVKFTRLVDGTPYFKDDWMKAVITLENGKEYSVPYAKLDLYDNELHYRSQKGDELTAITPIRKITIFDTVRNEQHNFVNGKYLTISTPPVGWYEVLVEGKASLYKKIEKKLQEDKPYGSATVEQTMLSLPAYFVLVNGELKEVRKTKDIPEILVAKENPVSDFVKTKKISVKNEDDLKAVVNYYNSLN